jgi:hypothetical protein
MAKKIHEEYSQDLLQEISTPRRGFWGHWLNLTALPRSEGTTAGPLKREELRKSELVGYFLFVLFLFMVFDFVLALRHPLTSLATVFLFLLVLIGVAWLNHKGKTNIAGTCLVLGMIFAVMSVIIFVLSRRENAADLLASYDFFVYPILIGSLFLPRNVLFPLTGLSIAFVVFHVLYGQHPAAVDVVLAESGPLTAILRPTSIIFTVSVIAWVAMGNFRRSLLQVDRAEELIAARQIVSEQAQQLANQNTRLAAGIAQVLHVHQEAARGNYAVRAQVYNEDLIWQVGHSLNNLLIRYERLALDSQELAQTRKEIEQIAYSLEETAQNRPCPLPPVNTPVGKHMIFALRHMQAVRPAMRLDPLQERSPYQQSPGSPSHPQGRPGHPASPGLPPSGNPFRRNELTE